MVGSNEMSGGCITRSGALNERARAQVRASDAETAAAIPVVAQYSAQ